jgi:hypothetical protein
VDPVSLAKNPLPKSSRRRITLRVKALSLFILGAAVASGAVVAKDGHGTRPVAASSSTYKSPARTYYSYSAPGIYKTPQSAYAPVSSTGTTTGTRTLKDTYRRVMTDQRMSKEWSAKMDQGVNKGITSAKNWVDTVKSKK